MKNPVPFLISLAILAACSSTPSEPAHTTAAAPATHPAAATPPNEPHHSAAPPAPVAAATDEDAHLPSAGARRPAYFRKPASRGEETIFSPLTLPTPTSVRTASGAPGPDYWQQQVDYSIDATLDADKKTIAGHEVVTYHNNSPEALPYLWLNLEQNLFRDDSLGSLSVEPGTRFGPHGFHGGLEIDSIQSVPGSQSGEGESAPRTLELHVYDTVGRLDLPAPIPAKGGTFKYEVAWHFSIPPYGEDRMGIDKVKQGTTFEMAQWFPGVCVFDDVHGWNTLPYLGQGEFYTNFGDYDVRITVPHDHICVATGVLQNPDDVLTETQRKRLAEARTSDKPVLIVAPDEVGKPDIRPDGKDPLTWHFKAHQVRTFAFASSDAFIWDADFLASAGPEEKDGKPEGTLCQSVYPKEANPVWGDHSTDDLRFSIEHYTKKWHRYPYPVATNVNGNVGGMEYPMIIFCGGRHSRRGLFGVTTHEIGHNWFPMLVNSDERRHAWMDEGFNTFINYYSEAARFEDQAREHHRRGNARDFVGAMKEGEQQPMDTPADRLWRGRLGTLEYAKTAVALVLLREVVLGPDRFDPAFRRYIDLWAFKSPQPADFFRVMEDAAGADLAWFWRGWFLETGTLDQAVSEVTQKSHKVYATFTNKGDQVMPLDFRVSYEDGSTEDRSLPVEVWYSTDQWTTTWDSDKNVVKVEIDPEGRLPDIDTANNVWEAPKQSAGK